MTGEQMATLFRYLRQPSTFQGIAGLLGLFGVVLAPEKWEAIAGGVAVVLTLIQLFRDEDKERAKTASAVVEDMERKGICGPPKAMLLPVFLLLPMISASCATMGNGGDDFVVASYKSLKAAAIFYDEGMRAVVDAQTAGLITPEEREEINAVAGEFRAAWNEATQSLYQYAENGGDRAPADVRMDIFGEYYRRFSRRIAPYIIRAL